MEIRPRLNSGGLGKLGPRRGSFLENCTTRATKETKHKMAIWQATRMYSARGKSNEYTGNGHKASKAYVQRTKERNHRKWPYGKQRICTTQQKTKRNHKPIRHDLNDRPCKHRLPWRLNECAGTNPPLPGDLLRRSSLSMVC